MTLDLRDGVSEGPRKCLLPSPLFTSISGFSVNQQTNNEGGEMGEEKLAEV